MGKKTQTTKGIKLPIFIKAPWLQKILPKVEAITFWFIVLHKGKLSASTKRHETIHYKQFNELLVAGLIAAYSWDFIKGLVKTGSWEKAYRQTRFEQEAYECENKRTYLDRRKRNAWRKYKV